MKWNTDEHDQTKAIYEKYYGQHVQIHTPRGKFLGTVQSEFSAEKDDGTGYTGLIVTLAYSDDDRLPMELWVPYEMIEELSLL